MVSNLAPRRLIVFRTNHIWVKYKEHLGKYSHTFIDCHTWALKGNVKKNTFGIDRKERNFTKE